MFDLELTAHLAELSKLAFTEDELKAMAEQMSDIVALMDKVKETDPSLPTYATDAVEYNNLRKDEAKPSFETEKILENAKNKKNSSFVVPKVV